MHLARCRLERTISMEAKEEPQCGVSRALGLASTQSQQTCTASSHVMQACWMVGELPWFWVRTCSLLSVRALPEGQLPLFLQGMIHTPSPRWALLAAERWEEHSKGRAVDFQTTPTAWRKQFEDSSEGRSNSCPLIPKDELVGQEVQKTNDS